MSKLHGLDLELAPGKSRLNKIAFLLGLTALTCLSCTRMDGLCSRRNSQSFNLFDTKAVLHGILHKLGILALYTFQFGDHSVDACKKCHCHCCFAREKTRRDFQWTFYLARFLFHSIFYLSEGETSAGLSLPLYLAHALSSCLCAINNAS